MLDPDKIYHIKEFTPPEECAVKWPERKYFQENGGRITVSELPVLEWFGTRFVPVI